MEGDRRSDDGGSVPVGFVMAVAGLVLADGFFAATSLSALRAYDAAPKNRSTDAGDDLSYALASFFAGGTSLLRDAVAIAVALAALYQIRRTRLLGVLRRLTTNRQMSQHHVRLGVDAPLAIAVLALGPVAVGCEVARVYVGWTAPHPTSTTFTWDLTACAVNAVAAAAIALAVVRMSRRHPQPHAGSSHAEAGHHPEMFTNER